jgi:hypothetical protein
MEKNISEHGRVHHVKNDIADRLKRDQKQCKYSYKLYLEGITGSPSTSKNKWAQEFGVHIYYWMYIHSAPFMAPRNTKLENFPTYLPVQTFFIFKCGLKEAELRTFCTETEKSLLYLLFGNVSTVNNWFSLVNVWENCGLNMQNKNAPTIILGIANPLDSENTNNQVILFSKY